MSNSQIPEADRPDMPSSQENDASEAEDAPNSDGQPRQRLTRRRRIWDWVTGRHGHIRDWLIAVFTAALTIATIFYVHYAGQQRDAMIDAVKQSTRASDAAEKAVAIAEQARLDSERATKESADTAKTMAKDASDKQNRLIAANEQLADAAKTSAASTASIVKQNEQLVKSAETQANASQATAKAAERTAGMAEQTLAISSQLIVGYIPKLARLTSGEPMLVDVLFVNKSNFIASITGGMTKFAFPPKGTAIATASFDALFGDGTPIPAFDLAPQSETSALRIASRVLSAAEVSDIKDGTLQVLIFIRTRVKGMASPLDSCYAYTTTIKDFAGCDHQQK